MYYCVECRGQKRHNIFTKPFFAIVIADQHHPAMLPALDGVCIHVIRYQDLSAAQLLTHTIWMLADSAENDVKPRSPDEHGACSVLQIAYEKGKDIHIFISSGSGLISDQAAGTSYQMQRGLNLISNEKLGKCKSNLFKRIIFLQPAIPSIPMPTVQTSIKEKLAMIEIEMSNAARLLSLNSSSGNFQLKTFLSATETVMVDEWPADKDDLRKWSNFQCVTKLKNWSTCTQVGEMQKCHLSRWPAWPSKGRSEGDALTLEFLAKYSAAVMVDMLHSLSLEKNAKEGTKNVVRTTPKVNQMVTLRANVQNMVMGIQSWNKEANGREDINEYGCYNVVRHREPAKFESITVWRAHCVECYGHERGAEGRRK